MKIYAMLAMLLLLFIVALPDTSQGEDFNFTVPVNLSNLPPEVTQGYVRCLVSRLNLVSHETGSAGNAGLLGEREVSFPISAGRYSGAVEVSFNAGPNKRPSDARTYACMLRLAGIMNGAPQGFAPNGRGSGLNFPTAAGSQLVDDVRAMIR
ncbi:MAG: hypothetical protein ACYC69_18165 [Thermodesulfovibrionales bacterium]